MAAWEKIAHVKYSDFVAYNSASDGVSRTTTSVSYVKYPTNASPTLTVSLTLTKQSLIRAYAIIPGVHINTKNYRVYFKLEIDGTQVAEGLMRQVTDTGGYVTAGTQEHTITLEGHKLCSAGSRTATVYWAVPDGGTGTGGDNSTAYIYIEAFPG